VARQDWIHKWLCYAGALLPVWWLDAYILTRLPVFGITPLLLPLVGMFVGALARYALARSLTGCMICSAGALTALLTVRGVADLFFMRASLWQLLRVAVPQLIWSLVWTPLVYGVFYRVYQRVGGDKLV